MKFLSKSADSEILFEGHTYRINGDNSILRALLLNEQKNFCAYSEKYIEGLDSVEVEHFNPSLKGDDNYYNYYAALRDCNMHNKKMYSTYRNASFFSSLFFQDKVEFAKRIKYDEGQYMEINEADVEATQLIGFLGFNRTTLYRHRQNHISRLKRTFEDAAYSEEQKIEHFRNHRQDLNFITAIEIELGLDLSEFYN
jgi:hypothetical protein